MGYCFVNSATASTVPFKVPAGIVAEFKKRNSNKLLNYIFSTLVEILRPNILLVM